MAGEYPPLSPAGRTPFSQRRIQRYRGRRLKRPQMLRQVESACIRQGLQREQLRGYRVAVRKLASGRVGEGQRLRAQGLLRGFEETPPEKGNQRGDGKRRQDENSVASPFAPGSLLFAPAALYDEFDVSLSGARSRKRPDGEPALG